MDRQNEPRLNNALLNVGRKGAFVTSHNRGLGSQIEASFETFLGNVASSFLYPVKRESAFTNCGLTRKGLHSGWLDCAPSDFYNRGSKRQYGSG